MSYCRTPLEVIINKYKQYTRNVYCKQYKMVVVGGGGVGVGWGGEGGAFSEILPILFLILGRE